ncbi:MAG TPA: cell division protein FtsK [Chloroflexi bacterium]|nr:cell division protein FtsK [Chloroflexota bacterium]HHW86775.1 DNA translocase FtsK [Chloroflexota bacterium]
MATKSTRRGKPTKKSAPRSKSAARRRTGGSANNELQQIGQAVFRPEVGGVLLVLLAIFTLLSLLTASRGQLTGGWIDLLTALFGVGVWGVPFVLGGVGLWIVIRTVDQMPNLSWRRPSGALLLFVAVITTLSLLLEPAVRMRAASEGDAGGHIGLWLANALERTLSRPGAWAFVTFMLVSSVVLIFDRALVAAWYALQEPRDAPPSAVAPVQLSWWRRLFAPPPSASLDAPVLTPPPAANLVRPEAPPPGQNKPTSPIPVPDAAPVRTAGPKLPLTKPIEELERRPAHVVGGAADWKLPAIDQILSDYDRVADDDNHIRMQGRLIQETLALFGVPADFEGAYKGPSVTQYLIKPGYVERKVGNEVQRVKVKVSKIAALSNDLALALAAASVRIEAPIPGTNYVGVEVPNQAGNIVGLKELMESEAFTEKKRTLPIALGEDVKGQPIVADLARMPHLLIAGATGSGKSVCINSIIACLLLTHTPDTLRLLMIDPKMVELSVYNGIPHLYGPVVTEVDKAAGVLLWAVKEMERRYTLFSKANARDLPRYNAYLEKNGEKPLPTIVVIVDEMADLMMAAPEEVEKHICRLAQMARAVGIHLIIATQRPSVDVITGLIKANFPSRIAFAVTSQIDSRVILDIPGAERLLGRGDMLFMAPDASKLERIQGTLVTDEEIGKLVRYWRNINTLDGFKSAASATLDLPGASIVTETAPKRTPPGESTAPAPNPPMSQPPLFEQIAQLRAAEARDELFYVAVNIVREHGRGSVNLLQRKLRIGYTRAARLVEQLHEAGVLGPDLGAGRGREYTGDDGPAAPRPFDADAPARTWDDAAMDAAPSVAASLDAEFDADFGSGTDATSARASAGHERAWDEDVPWDENEDDSGVAPPASPASSSAPPSPSPRPAAPPTVWF